MSEVDIDFHVEFKDARTRNVINSLLASYDHDNSRKKSYRKQLEILESAGMNGDRLFNDDTSDCDISDIESIGDKTLRFHLFGGVHGGTHFYERLLSMLLESGPMKVYTLVYNNQVGEIEAYAYKDGAEAHYYTGENGASDDLLFDILGQENTLDLLIHMHSEGKLTMAEHEPELINGVDVKVLEDEELYDAQILSYLKSGAIFGIAVFLVGWLVLEYFWTSLLGGVVTAVIVTFTGAFKLQNALDKYDQEVDQMIKEDAEELGISEDQVQALIQYLEQSMNCAEESAK